MKILEVTRETKKRLPARSSCCGRAFRVGQWAVLREMTRPGVYVDLTTADHVACLRARLEAIPEDLVEASDPTVAFSAERRQLVKAGRAA
jgi:hypothetical protein